MENPDEFLVNIIAAFPPANVWRVFVGWLMSDFLRRARVIIELFESFDLRESRLKGDHEKIFQTI
jgi:hypothetical protein